MNAGLGKRTRIIRKKVGLKSINSNLIQKQ